jgi:hypothetical protein
LVHGEEEFHPEVLEYFRTQGAKGGKIGGKIGGSVETMTPRNAPPARRDASAASVATRKAKKKAR